MVFLAVMGISTLHAHTYYSQAGQDQFVNETFFKDKRHGIFIDIGAHDGMLINNTYFFERNLGWRGICIEPIPEIFEQLVKNRICTCIKGCISDFTGTAPFLRLKGLDMYSGIIDKFDPQHMDRITREMEVYNDTATVIQVKTFLLNELLEKYNLYHVDLLSIDTEGGELDILKSIDFERFDIDVITVENNYEALDFREFMESKGYQFVVRLNPDDIYKKIYE